MWKFEAHNLTNTASNTAPRYRFWVLRLRVTCLLKNDRSYALRNLQRLLALILVKGKGKGHSYTGTEALYRPTTHRGSRGIALLFHDHGTRRGWGVSVTSQLPFTPEEDPVPIVQEAGWAPGPVWTGAENLAPTSIWSPDRPAHSQSLYRLSYPTHNLVVSHVQNVLCMWVQHIDSEPYCCLSVIDFIDETWLPQTFICLTYWKMSWRWAISIWWHCQCWVPEGDLRVTHLFLPLGLAKSHHILC